MNMVEQSIPIFAGLFPQISPIMKLPSRLGPSNFPSTNVAQWRRRPRRTKRCSLRLTSLSTQISRLSEITFSILFPQHLVCAAHCAWDGQFFVYTNFARLFSRTSAGSKKRISPDKKVHKKLHNEFLVSEMGAPGRRGRLQFRRMSHVWVESDQTNQLGPARTPGGSNYLLRRDWGGWFGGSVPTF